VRFYPVRVGRLPGMYYSWKEARTQVDGFSRPEYAFFKSRAEADHFFRATPVVHTLSLEGNAVQKPPYATGSGLHITYPEGSIVWGKTITGGNRPCSFRLSWCHSIYEEHGWTYCAIVGSSVDSYASIWLYLHVQHLHWF